MFLILEKTKKKISFVFGAILIFCVINRFMRCFGIFHVFFSIFLFRNMLACVPNEPASGWSPRHSGDTCDVTRWPNLDFHRLTGYTTVSLFTWCGAYRSIVVELSQVVICFFFLSLLITKVHHRPFCCLIFNFNYSSFNLLSDVKCE